jgi:hypothetical protein
MQRRRRSYEGLAHCARRVHRALYSPIGVRPMVEMTGLRRRGKVRAALDISDSSGGWRRTGIQAVVTMGGVIAYPGLERRAEVAGQPPRRYRIRLEADLYRPSYRASSEAIAFDAYHYNDANPPQVIRFPNSKYVSYAVDQLSIPHPRGCASRHCRRFDRRRGGGRSGDRRSSGTRPYGRARRVRVTTAPGAEKCSRLHHCRGPREPAGWA